MNTKQVTLNDSIQHQATFQSSLRRKKDQSFSMEGVSAARALFKTGGLSESKTLNVNTQTIGAVTIKEQGPEYCQNEDLCHCTKREPMTEPAIDRRVAFSEIFNRT